MKKILSCVLAIALVFSLMSMTVFADADAFDVHPAPADGKAAATYNVVGNQATGGTTDDGSYTDGDTTLPENQENTANVNVSFSYDTQQGTNTGNVINHRYAIDIEYAELVFDLADVVTNTESEIQYSFEWNVNTHTYDMVNLETNEVVTETATLEGQISIDSAFQVINHSDMPVAYGAEITVDQAYAPYLILNINDSNPQSATNGDDVASVTETISASKATLNNDGVTWTAANQVPGTAYTIVADPVNDWAETIGILATGSTGNVGATDVKIGQIVITINPTT